MFSLKNEGYFTYMNGWIVSGSEAAVRESAGGRALSYNLKEYMANADLQDMLSDGPASFKAYLSLTEDADVLENFAHKTVMQRFASLYEGVDYSGIVLTVGRNSEVNQLSVDMFRNEIKRSKAPVAERNTEIVVSRGPFKVKNSLTGKMNTFYQNAQKSLCLRDENGKDLWGVPFGKPLCGTAQNVDYYANGKLQIIFGSGSKIYVIDRLGRFVTGFPVDLGKEILVGPDVYDFNGTKAYNIMVLHKDNTIEMYNLKGRKPSSWKTIIAPETIKGLPEPVKVGGNTFWVVRTSIQTLIYPFSGGSALTSFKGDQMIRPDSEVKPLEDKVSVSVSCYDGQTRTVKLK